MNPNEVSKEDLVKTAMGKAKFLKPLAHILIGICFLSLLIGWMWFPWYWIWRTALTGLLGFIIMFCIHFILERKAETYIEGLLADWKSQNPES